MKGECLNFEIELYILPKREYKTARDWCVSEMRKFQSKFRSYSQQFKHIFGVAAAAASASAYLIMSTILPAEMNQTTGFIPFLVFKCFVQNRNNNKQRERTADEKRMSRWL